MAPNPVLPGRGRLRAGSSNRPAHRWSWLVAGLVFGLLAAVIWVHALVVILALAGGLGMAAGASVGEKIWRAIEAPTARSVALTVAGLGVMVPALTGAADLYLRLHTS